MRKLFLLLVFLLLVLSGCEYANIPLPEKVCIKTENLEVLTNGSGLYVGNGQVEVQLNGCEFRDETK